MAAVFHPLKVAAVEELTDDAVAVTFEVPDDLAGEFEFVPGQSLTLRRMVDAPDGPSEQRRQYSICAPAGSRPRVGVREIPDGLFSRWLVHDVRAGDEIEVQTPSGRFCPDPALLEGGRHLCIAAGSGITPMLSVASSVLANDGDVTLLYGNRTTGSVMFLDELADLKDRYPERFRLVHVLSREPQEAELLSGRLDPARLRRLLAALLPPESVDEWFLCGPFAMVEGAREVLAEAGVDAGHVHTELFHVEGEAPRESVTAEAVRAAGTSSVRVTLDGRGSTVQVPRTGVRILDAVLAVRADAPYACKGGVCGTCRAKLLTGEVTMARNYALDPEETAAGFVLACQSVPVSEDVELDFDA
jgi:ring-1,2-phenylacetyl-CoA epoxidase subunit PaaE